MSHPQERALREKLGVFFSHAPGLLARRYRTLTVFEKDSGANILFGYSDTAEDEDGEEMDDDEWDVLVEELDRIRAERERTVLCTGLMSKSGSSRCARAVSRREDFGRRARPAQTLRLAVESGLEPIRRRELYDEQRREKHAEANDDSTRAPVSAGSALAPRRADSERHRGADKGDTEDAVRERLAVHQQGESEAENQQQYGDEDTHTSFSQSRAFARGHGLERDVKSTTALPDSPAHSRLNYAHLDRGSGHEPKPGSLPQNAFGEAVGHSPAGGRIEDVPLRRLVAHGWIQCFPGAAS